MKEGLQMEEILKQILEKLNNMETTMNDNFNNLNDRIEMHDKSNKQEFKEINKKLDSITDAVAMTMENVTDLKSKVEKQDVEIRVIKGGR